MSSREGRLLLAVLGLLACAGPPDPVRPTLLPAGGSGGTPPVDDACPEGTALQPGDLRGPVELLESPAVEPAAPGDATGLCRPDGWCWVDTTPTALPLRTGIAAGDEIWMGGERELLRLRGGAFTSSAWEGIDVQALAARDARDVWMAGGAEIAHFDGARWRRWEVPPAHRAVSVALTGTEAWFVLDGSPAMLLRAAGGGFTLEHPEGLVPRAVAATGEVLIAAGAGGVFRWTGAGWEREAAELDDATLACTAAGHIHVATPQLRRRYGASDWRLVSGIRVADLRCGDRLHLLDVDRWKDIDGSPLLGSGTLLLVDAAGTPWWSDGELRRGEEVVGARQTGTLAVDAAGDLWMARTGAFFREHEEWRAVPGTGEHSFHQLVAGADVLGVTGPDLYRLRREGAEDLGQPPGPLIAGGGEIWAVDQRPAAWRYSDGVFTELPPTAASTLLFVPAGPAEGFSIGRTARAGIERLQGGAWHALPGTLEISRQALIPLADGDGLLVAAWDRVEGGHVTSLTRFTEDGPTRVLLPGPGDRPFSIAIAGGTIRELRPGILRRRDLASWQDQELALSPAEVRVDPAGRAWTVGLDLRREDEGGVLRRVPPVPGGQIRDVAFDGDDVWAAADGAILHVRGELAEVIPTGTAGELRAIAAAGGQVLAGGRDLLELAGGKVRVIRECLEVQALAAAAPGDVWAAGTSLLHLEEGVWVERGGSGVGDIVATAPDDVWFAAGTRLLHWDGSRITEVLAPVAADGFISDLASPSRGELWLVGNLSLHGEPHDVVRLHGGRWIAADASLAPPGFPTLGVTPAGAMLALDGHLLRVSGAVTTPLGEAPLASRAFAAPADGSLWLEGLALLRRAP